MRVFTLADATLFLCLPSLAQTLANCKVLHIALYAAYSESDMIMKSISGANKWLPDRKEMHLNTDGTGRFKSALGH